MTSRGLGAHSQAIPIIDATHKTDPVYNSVRAPCESK